MNKFEKAVLRRLDHIEGELKAARFDRQSNQDGLIWMPGTSEKKRSVANRGFYNYMLGEPSSTTEEQVSRESAMQRRWEKFWLFGDRYGMSASEYRRRFFEPNGGVKSGRTQSEESNMQTIPCDLIGEKA